MDYAKCILDHDSTSAFPKNLKGQQLDGFTRDANQLLYGVEIEANTGSSALSDTPRSSSEAPLFDVARKLSEKIGKS